MCIRDRSCTVLLIYIKSRFSALTQCLVPPAPHSVLGLSPQHKQQKRIFLQADILFHSLWHCSLLIVYHTSSFISPFLIHPFLRMYSLMLRVTMAGRMICIIYFLFCKVAAGSVWFMVCLFIICHTSPAVPIPEPVALLVI